MPPRSDPVRVPSAPRPGRRFLSDALTCEESAAVVGALDDMVAKHVDGVGADLAHHAARCPADDALAILTCDRERLREVRRAEP